MLGGRGNRELFHRYKILVLQVEKSSGDWLHNNMKVLSTMDFSLKNSYDGKLYIMCVLQQFKKSS